MKRLNVLSGILIIVILIVTLVSCNNGRSIYEMERDAESEALESLYDEGYEEGSSSGYYTGYDEGYSEGYSKGYDEGYNEGYSEVMAHFENIIEYDAIHYAREYSIFHPEEALCIIDDYENGEPVTEEDYNEAIESLYRYCEYLYYKEYDK